MKYGFIKSDNRAMMMISEIENMRKTGVPIENIFISTSFDEVLMRAKRGDKIIVSSYSDIFTGLDKFMNSALDLLKSGVEMESIYESNFVVCKENYDIINCLVILDENINIENSKRVLVAPEKKITKSGRPKINDKIEKVTKLRETTALSIAKACKAIGCNQRTYYRYLANSRNSQK